MDFDDLKLIVELGGRYEVTFEPGGKLISLYPIPEGYRYSPPDVLLEILLSEGYKIIPDDV